MDLIVSFIIKIFTTPTGQAILTWLVPKIWKYVSDEVKDYLSNDRWEDHVKDTLAKYDAVIEEARIKAQDGLTEEEKNEIRRKKIELEESLINSRPR